MPPVAITSIIANGQAFPTWRDVVLPKHTKDLEVDFSSPESFPAAAGSISIHVGRVRQGLAGRRTTKASFYTGLPPGRYRMRVVARNNDGVWNDTGANVNLRLLPAFTRPSGFGLYADYPRSSSYGGPTASGSSALQPRCAGDLVNA